MSDASATLNKSESMSDWLKTVTVFLKFGKAVKKVIFPISSIYELHDIAAEKFPHEIGDACINLYIEDKEFNISCELESAHQLYHGAIIEMRLKSPTEPRLESVCSHFSNATHESVGSSMLSLDLQSIDLHLSQLGVPAPEQLPKHDHPEHHCTPLSLPLQQQSEHSCRNKSYAASVVIANSDEQNSNEEPPPTAAAHAIMPDDTTTTTAANLTTAAAAAEAGSDDNFLYFPQTPDEQRFYDEFEIPVDKHYVVMQGVPFSARNQEIVAFFRGIPIYEWQAGHGIFFVLNCQRNRTGQVFVIFEHYHEYQAALKKSDHLFANRRIRVADGKFYELEKCVKIAKGVDCSHFNLAHFYVKLKGFSFDMDEARIMHWLHEHGVYPLKCFIMYDHRNRNAGVCYLEFEQQQNAEHVFTLNHEYIGNRYVNMFMSSWQDLILHVAENVGTALSSDVNPYLNCLRIEGLPSTFSVRNIHELFMVTAHITPKYVHLKRDIGIAYAEFKGQFECQVALSRNDTFVYSRYKPYKSWKLCLRQVSKYELRSVVGDDGTGAIATDCVNHVAPTPTPTPTSMSASFTSFTSTSAPTSASTSTIMSADHDVNFSYEFQNYHNHTIGMTPSHLNCTVSDHDTRRHHQQQHCSVTGCLVSIRGIPFNATPQDVMDFFRGYDVKSLRLIRDHKGRFSGQATVAFDDRQQALRAVTCLDRKYIGSRYVLLRIFC